VRRLVSERVQELGGVSVRDMSRAASADRSSHDVRTWRGIVREGI
jgi:hypothetical protein